jgi:Type II CAAX prenyl endopeptidase Rce1-like
MNNKKQSTITFFILLAMLALSAGLNSFLPQGNIASQIPKSPIPKWLIASVATGGTFVIYGILGFIGLILWRKIGFPDIWDDRVTNKQRFLTPAIVGALIGVVLIILDLVFSPINGVGQIIHPPFPTSIVASLSAGIGEEMLFRLFFISFWTWLIGKVILRGRGLSIVYWVVAIFSAIAHGASHLPTAMILFGVNTPALLPPVLLAEIILMNGILSIFAAYYFKKFGLFAPIGIHFWADIVWHTIWGLF